MKDLPLYQILGWNETFENNKSRQRDRCSFVCVPNKHGGSGYTALTSEPNGHGLYGIWVMIVETCSRQRAPRMGFLTADGKPDGWRLGSEELGHMLRVPASEVRRCLAAVSSPRIGWMRLVEGAPEVPVSAVTASDSYADTQSDLQVTAEVTAETDTSTVTPSDSYAGTERKKEGKKEPPIIPPKGGIGEDTIFTLEDTKKWISDLFGRKKEWSQLEIYELSRLCPVTTQDRELLTWAYSLPTDIDGYALFKGHRLTKRKMSLLSLVQAFQSEVEKWQQVRKDLNGSMPKPREDDRMPPEWATAIKKLYGEDAFVPDVKSRLDSELQAEIEREVQNANQAA